jgi:hypothetical protein
MRYPRHCIAGLCPVDNPLYVAPGFAVLLAQMVGVSPCAVCPLAGSEGMSRDQTLAQPPALALVHNRPAIRRITPHPSPLRLPVFGTCSLPPASALFPARLFPHLRHLAHHTWTRGQAQTGPTPPLPLCGVKVTLPTSPGGPLLPFP